MDIFSAQKNRSTTAPSLMSHATRNFHLEVFVKQMFAIFRTTKPTEILRSLHFADDMDLSKCVCIHRKNPPYAEILLNGQDVAYIYHRALKRKKVLQVRVVSLIKCKMMGSGM